ncbi:ribonuclease R [Mycoplasma sp. Mirounga ES2805-ORL]|uniref:ribonuclease R n=1 Tax=Mycoplasma sp. Mirounga ES2805-ORL TaxID=754514 RepID=UPI00197B5188|nr:ribonuclease R [Mycoplasma sp. Mirounga ES2805-ORL]QSF13438.1 ribonuclease R [Mycoplasma sp. Mirounga ES2805-ORL]
MIKKEEILAYIKGNPNSRFIDIVKRNKIHPSKNRELTSILKDLVFEHKIYKSRDDSYSLLEKINTITGEIRFAGEGKFAFVDFKVNDSETEGIFIPNIYFNKAMNGDTVKVGIFKPQGDKNGKTFGIVESIIKSQTTTLTGVLFLKYNQLAFKPLNANFSIYEFVINDNYVDARLEDVVEARIISNNGKLLEINIVKKISNIGDPNCYVKALSIEKNIPNDFPKEVLDAASLIPQDIKDENIDDRVDLRNELIVTIDGDDTKDFDDAISVKKLDNGNFELGVHIADVSYYVKEGESIDNEALERGTSIYMVHKVVPMLPTSLSNGICSLNPNVDRFTLSVITTVDKNGKRQNTKIIPSIINSKYRLTYDRVNKFISENLVFGDKKLNEMMTQAVELADIIRNYKNEQGYIDFEIVEPYIKCDDKGNVIDILAKETGRAESLIEDFMVCANEEVATYLTRKKIPMIYRIHDKPDEEKIEYFKMVLNELGIKVNISKNEITPKSFQKIIREIKSQRDDEFLKMLFLRTMSKAIYSPDNVGHFGLASEEYCHFTSPIRRYPDLVVHRILRNYIFNNKKFNRSEVIEKLEKIAIANSESEQKALQAERDTNDLKYAEYYKSKVGQLLKGQILSILKFGMFVEFENKTEALVHVSTMIDDEYELSESQTEYIGKNKTYKLGQEVEVIIVKSDPTNGKVDAVLKSCYGKYLQSLKNKSKYKNNFNNGNSKKYHDKK